MNETYDLADIARTAAEALPADNWDLPPSLGFVFAEGDSVTVAGIPLPDSAWGAYHPAEVLSRLTASMRRSSAPPPPRGSIPLGVIFCFEAYAAHVPIGTPRAEIAAFEKWADDHSLADHPWSKETRSVILVGFDGTCHWAHQVRGEPDPEVNSHEHLDDWPTGRIPDALAEFTHALRDALA